MSKIVDDSNVCNVCLEECNRHIKISEDLSYRTGKKITCYKCDYISCTYCTKKYLLSSNNDAHCMNCKQQWDREFLSNNFTKTFITKDYKKHRENTLCNREKALLPSTMKIIDRENRIIELREEQEQIRNELQKKLEDIDIEIWNIQNYRSKRKDKNKFIKKCSVNDCNGFLSSQWKCGICSTYACSKCHEIIGKRQKLDNGSFSELPEHECKEENVKTAMLLNKECKNCPKCAAPIYKIDGCNQMWCVECKTAFDWKTNEIITGGYFHNPHYYEWLRQNNNGREIPRNPNDNLCNDNAIVSIMNLQTKLNKIYTNNVKTFTKYNLKYIIYFLQSLHRECIHINYVIIEDLNDKNLLNDENYLFNLNVELRKKLLKNEITEDTFKQEIQKKEKKRLKAIDKKQIYETFRAVCNDIFRKIVDDPTIDNLMISLNEIINFINHINEQFVKHSKIFNCIVHTYNLVNRVWNNKYSGINIEPERYNKELKVFHMDIFLK